MKKPISLICCVALAVFGWVMGMQNKPLALPAQTINAAQLPYDLRLGRVETVRDTVYVPSDTVYVPGKKVVVTKIKEVPVISETLPCGTLYIPGLVLTEQADRTHTAAKQDSTSYVLAPAGNDSVHISE